MEIPGARHIYSGKVRDLYELDEARLLIVASDRISAYDQVLASTIPDKGEILTRMSLWWFEQVADLGPNHVLAADVPAVVRGRAVVCERLEMYPVECVARGYLAGSGLLDYRATGGICGVDLPAGLEQGSRLPTPIFTPATKAAVGEHDENVSYAAVVATVGEEPAAILRDLTLAVYGRAERVARDRGIILADTKLEFGRRQDGTIVLADELLTPDSSRFWPAARWAPGRSQPSYDKQTVRDWLTSPASGWGRESGGPPPPLPEDVVATTRATYIEAYERLTGQRY
ncbi:MAG: phosphoribosylaminoimidazolesuccinocarboxamide synthase [Nocardioidaceae bacterium]